MMMVHDMMVSGSEIVVLLYRQRCRGRVIVRYCTFRSACCFLLLPALCAFAC
jgi:hypothetical protein